MRTRVNACILCVLPCAMHGGAARCLAAPFSCVAGFFAFPLSVPFFLKELVPQSTIGAAFTLKSWNDKKLGIWDTAGQEKFAKLSAFYCRGAGAAILVFDVTSRASFDALSQYLQLLESSQPASPCHKLLVGSKCDLAQENPALREVSVEDAADYAQSLGASYTEVSAKTGENVTSLFNKVGYVAFNEAPAASAAASAGSSQVRSTTASANEASASRNAVDISGATAPAERKKGCCE